jgi:hypothetical protein
MLTFLALAGRSSERKTRLTQCAFLRRFWHALPDVRSRRAIEVAEQYADGLVPRRTLEKAQVRAKRAFSAAVQHETSKGCGRSSFYRGYLAAAQFAADAFPTPPSALQGEASSLRVWNMTRLDWIAQAAAPIYYRDVSQDSAFATIPESGPVGWERALAQLRHFWGDACHGQACQAAVAAERAAQAELLRDLFGNPFRPAALEPTWRTPDVLALASVIYAEGAFERLPILADALEEAGCDNGDVLAHCRQPVPHVKGCWLLDRLLALD